MNIARLAVAADRRGRPLQILAGFANVAANQTDAALVAAVPGFQVMVLSMFAHLQGGTALNVTFNSKPSGAGSAISSTKQVAPNGGFVQTRGCEADFLFATKNGEGLSVTTGATGSTVGLDFTYVLFPND